MKLLSHECRQIDRGIGHVAAACDKRDLQLVVWHEFEVHKVESTSVICVKRKDVELCSGIYYSCICSKSGKRVSLAILDPFFVLNIEVEPG